MGQTKRIILQKIAKGGELSAFCILEEDVFFKVKTKVLSLNRQTPISVVYNSPGDGYKNPASP
jgi:hypothetical protein